ncbi:hypothetical protein EQP59_08490 [Ornithobacterium rhinotracheale]|uniref:Lipoprotein n=1 Tax=Ornithobacterium rhinotracheale TaxID=28251 RepID=A0A410JT56_ORNRH|nr:hypothetical protein [Ornithobacterium rhinotracheale]QAR31376.1 hypothetical protein EQP59_08490 [Ornithobacterium rhinotracheale]
MRKIIILIVGFMLFSACTDGTLSIMEEEPKRAGNSSESVESNQDKTPSKTDSIQNKGKQENLKLKHGRIITSNQAAIWHHRK